MLVQMQNDSLRLFQLNAMCRAPPSPVSLYSTNTNVTVYENVQRHCLITLSFLSSFGGKFRFQDLPTALLQICGAFRQI